MQINPLLWAVLGVALLVSVVTDLLQRRILELVTYPSLLVLLGIRWVGGGVGDAEAGLVSGLIGAAGAAAFFALLARSGWMGWGDVALMGVVGAAFGYPLVLSALVFISLVGAVQAVVTLLWLGAVWETLAGVGRRLRARLFPKAAPLAEPKGKHIPYGVAIALGSAWTVWWQGTTGG